MAMRLKRILSLPSWYQVISYKYTSSSNKKLSSNLDSDTKSKPTFWLSSSRFSCSSFFLSFCAISSSLSWEITVFKRSRRSAGPSPNKQMGSASWRRFALTSKSSVETWICRALIITMTIWRERVNYIERTIWRYSFAALEFGHQLLLVIWQLIELKARPVLLIWHSF